MVYKFRLNNQKNNGMYVAQSFPISEPKLGGK